MQVARTWARITAMGVGLLDCRGLEISVCKRNQEWFQKAGIQSYEDMAAEEEETVSSESESDSNDVEGQEGVRIEISDDEISDGGGDEFDGWDSTTSD